MKFVVICTYDYYYKCPQKGSEYNCTVNMFLLILKYFALAAVWKKYVLAVSFPNFLRNMFLFCFQKAKRSVV